MGSGVDRVPEDRTDLLAARVEPSRGRVRRWVARPWVVDDARMVELSKGANIWLVERDVTIGVEFPADAANVDLFSVLVRADGSAVSDLDLVFFNQPSSLCGAVTLAEVATVQVRLDSVPAEVATIVIAAALDDLTTGTFESCGPGEVTVRSAAGILATHTIVGLTDERCVVLVEIYRRYEQWKIRAVCQGWVNGIADLIESYGIVVDGPEPESTVAPKGDVIVVPDEFGAEPIGSGEHAWRKKLAERPLDRFEELHAAEYGQGLVRGTHFLKWSDEVARLKREGHLQEALTVLLEILDASERVQAQERANAPARAEWFQKFGQDVVVRETPPGWTEKRGDRAPQARRSRGGDRDHRPLAGTCRRSGALGGCKPCQIARTPRQSTSTAREAAPMTGYT
ncbi:TerD family protein [Rhodococcus sp. NM-2]|uniref:TerD family protein n=1 Tax=Rhodococcus sp. NM-2 TaxID=3401174 RepID=UPI003AACB458